MKTRPLLLLLAPLCIAGCTVIPPAEPRDTAPPPPSQAPTQAPAGNPSSLAYAALGQTVTVDGPRVTPIEVLEDSRCPMNARCVWAGQVRLRVRIDLGSGGTMQEITSGKPVQVADGSLELAEVQPEKVTGGTIDPATYRFGFRFMGGL
ncbi:hypothetical protein SAMN05518801_106193 [Novosphingobium sp. CF614]|uniref:hypothetical protein n=1 Tax=Novosphingobium sp. CF614 TaxID=1884364 RepID=UPI0008EC6C04|nr:hypothetical protein [Novosphingobium sp. CF614]SFG05926.1 hypothetical protein SAMN05518801_106193 [Novosphingobium sp. CF614]